MQAAFSLQNPPSYSGSQISTADLKIFAAAINLKTISSASNVDLARSTGNQGSHHECLSPIRHDQATRRGVEESGLRKGPMTTSITA